MKDGFPSAFAPERRRFIRFCPPYLPRLRKRGSAPDGQDVASCRRTTDRRRKQQDFLSLSVEFTANEVIAAVLNLDSDLTEKIMNESMEEQAMHISDRAVIWSVSRLFPIMGSMVPSEFLRKNIMQEVIYNILCGSCGRQLLQSIVNISKADEMYEANTWIKENFRNSFTVEELAERRNMSVSLFHQKFKSAVGMGPLQCQKRLRLTEARRLMLDEKKM